MMRRADRADETGSAKEREAHPSTTFANNIPWLLYSLGILYALYFIVSQGGLWTENDTAVFIASTKATLAARNVLFPGQYSHGFGYPGWLGSLALMTGTSVTTADTLVAPFIGVTFLMVGSFLTYRTLLRHEGTAALATVLLLALPDVMFTVLRGNHEKLNVFFALTDFFVLFKGFQAVRSRKNVEILTWVLIYYALVFCNTATNDYFGSTVVFISVLTVLFLVALFRIRRRYFHIQSVALRFGASIATSWLLIWLVMLFVFPQDGQDFLLLDSVGKQLSVLFTTLAPSSNPYAEASQQWITPAVGYLTGISRDLLIAGSLVWFLIQLTRLLRRRRMPAAGEVFLLGAFFAYAMLIAVSVPIDLLGLAAGANLEVRNFNYFALMGAPVAAWGVQAMRTPGRRSRSLAPARGRARWRPIRLSANFLLGAVLVVLVTGGALKATLSPVISNQWIFYSPYEREALGFFYNHNQGVNMWTGPDDRLVNLFEQSYPVDVKNDIPDGYDLDSRPQNRDILWSPIVSADVIANGYPVPDLSQMNRVYDNGGAQIYRIAPATPLQN